jgi:hypothetical protein
MLDDNKTDKMFDDLVLEKTTLLTELKTVYNSLNNESAKKERIINGKLSAVESMIRSILKYKNIIAKEKYQKDL